MDRNFIFICGHPWLNLLRVKEVMDKKEFLKSVDMFSHFSDEVLAKSEQITEIQSYKPGEVIFAREKKRIISISFTQAK